MTSLVTVQRDIEYEIQMSEQCLVNILERLDEDIARANERKLHLMERLDEDIARINERKPQLMDEFAARRRNLAQLIGIETQVVEAKPDSEEEIDYDAR